MEYLLGIIFMCCSVRCLYACKIDLEDCEYNKKLMIVNDTCVCTQCDAGEYWKQDSNTCSACIGEYTSCKPNVLTGACDTKRSECHTGIIPETTTDPPSSVNVTKTLTGPTLPNSIANATTHNDIKEDNLSVTSTTTTDNSRTYMIQEYDDTNETTANDNGTDKSGNTENDAPVNIIIIIFVPVAGILIIIVCCIIYWYPKRKREKKRKRTTNKNDPTLPDNNNDLEETLI